MSEDTSDVFETPTNSKRAYTLGSKRKTCPSKLECKTPKSDLGTPLKPAFSSANIRRSHRLTEDQKAQLRQRRLEFLTTSVAAGSKKDENTSPPAPEDPVLLSKQELLELIKKSEIELESRSQHDRKVKELEDRIETWRTGLNQVLDDLQGRFEVEKGTRIDKKSILKQLNLPLDAIKYVDDSEDE